MMPFAVSTTGVVVIDFLGIYPQRHNLSGCPPAKDDIHTFCVERFVCDYLTNTIKISKIPKDSYSSPNGSPYGIFTFV